MSRNRDEIIQEIRNWKGFISNVENIPLNPNHKYKDENDIYERLSEFVKDWVEGVFGVYTNENGEFENIPEDEQSTETKDWLSVTGQKLSPLSKGWFEGALNAKKGEALPLPSILSQVVQTKKAKKTVYEDVRFEVSSTFFPAYRALRDSFSKRWWFEWIFNHKQYVAERDALKVMTNLITSLTGYTKEELDQEYINHKTTITKEHLKEAKAPQRDLQVDQVQNLLENAERLDFIDLENGQRVVEGDKTELFRNIGRIDEKFVEEKVDNQEEIEQKKEVPVSETAEAQFKKLDDDEKGFFQDVIEELADEIEGAGILRKACKESLPRHIYAPLSNEAKSFCIRYDSFSAVKASDPEKFKTMMVKSGISTAEKMFQAAFKAFSAVSTVNNVPVFGEMSLTNRIISAQKVTDLMLKKLSPVGFDSKTLGHLANGAYLFENSNKVLDFVKANCGDKYSEQEIDSAVLAANKEFGMLYRGARPEIFEIFKPNYRPNPNKLSYEGKAISEAQKLTKGETPVINDPALKAVINANAGKWKLAKGDKGGVLSPAQEAARLKQWTETEKKFSELYPNYDPVAAQNLVNETVAQSYAPNRGEKVEIKLEEKPVNVVPPVQEVKQNPSPQIEK